MACRYGLHLLILGIPLPNVSSRLALRVHAGGIGTNCTVAVVRKCAAHTRPANGFGCVTFPACTDTKLDRSSAASERGVSSVDTTYGWAS
ncbi:hypothetical protein BX600DRAFT_451664 [Xylariales sp. PMI_506]|nr:hypothetical protein BX600DRAFT_451664 [Xylariales sp. PMI_506]